jgi:HlyD family secretion protein
VEAGDEEVLHSFSTTGDYSSGGGTVTQLATRTADPLPGPSPDDLRVIGPPARRARWRWVAGGLLGVVALVGGAAGLAVRAVSGGGGSYTTEVSVASDLVVEVTAVGTLEPVSTVDIGSDLTGKVARVLVDENAQVAAGELLAEIDRTPFEAAVDEARARVSSAEAAVAKARVELDRATLTRDRTARLVGRGAATEVEATGTRLDADAAQAALDSALADRAQARAALVSADRDLADTEIRSPIDGVVLHRLVEPGQTVVSAMSATSLFEVASDLGALQVDVGVDEADVATVSDGLPVTFTVSAWPDRTFPATVASVDVAPDPDAEVTQYDARLQVDNTERLLRAGMTVTAAIRTRTIEGAVLVPNRALRWRPRSGDGPGATTEAVEGDGVYVLDGGAPRLVTVTVLGTDGVHTAVRGLEPGAAVVVGGGS